MCCTPSYWDAKTRRCWAVALIVTGVICVVIAIGTPFGLPLMYVHHVYVLRFCSLLFVTIGTFIILE